MRANTARTTTAASPETLFLSREATCILWGLPAKICICIRESPAYRLFFLRCIEAGKATCKRLVAHGIHAAFSHGLSRAQRQYLLVFFTGRAVLHHSVHETAHANAHERRIHNLETAPEYFLVPVE